MKGNMDKLTLKVSEVKNNPNNPRLIKDDKFKKLVKSIKEFPEMLDAREIVVNKDHIILGGNMRFKAAKEAGLKEVPVKIVDWSEDKQRQFVIKDNVSGGEWDWDILANEWDAEELDDWGLDTPDDWGEEKEVEEDEAPEVDESEPPKSKLGEIYQLGRHRIMCGDSTDTSVVSELMAGTKADMVFTDPPYNVDYVGKTKEALKIQNDKSSLFEFRKLISDFIDVMLEHTKKGSSYYVCMPLEVGVTDLFLEKSHLQSVIMWLKNTIVMGRKDYQQKTEPILHLTDDEYFTDEASYQGVIYGWKFGDRHEWYGGRKQSNVWEFDKPQRNGDHPTTKPIALVAKAIKNSSKPGGVVLDQFLGSGSTLIACEQTDRICYGMELDPKYVDVIRKRYHKFVTGNEDGWEYGTPVTN